MGAKRSVRLRAMALEWLKDEGSVLMEHHSRCDPKDCVAVDSVHNLLERAVRVSVVKPRPRRKVKR